MASAQVIQLCSLLRQADALRCWGRRADALKLLRAAALRADLKDQQDGLDLCLAHEKLIAGLPAEALILLGGQREGPLRQLFEGFRGVALAQLGRDKEARPLLDASLRKQPLEIFRRSLAGLLIRNGAADEAEPLLAAENDPLSWLLLGSAFEARGRSAEALSQFERAMPYLEEERAMLWAAATSLCSIRHYHSALKLFRRLAAEYPDDARVRLRYGLCLGLVGLQVEALGEFQRVLELEPDSKLARREQCRALIKLGRHRPAARLLERHGLDEDEDLLLAAAAWERLGDLERARRLCERLRRQTPFSRFLVGTLARLGGQSPQPGPALLPPELRSDEDGRPYPFSVN